MCAGRAIALLKKGCFFVVGDVLRAVRLWAQRIATDKNLVRVKLDVRNAYNSISRHSYCEVADVIDPELGQWAR